jgi:signal transduction histidine kinase
MTVLLTQVLALRQQVEQLAHVFAGLKNPLIDHIVARMQDLEDAVKALPVEPEAHHLRNLLTPIQGYARLMHIQPSQLELTSYTHEQEVQFERVNACGNAINDTITIYVGEMRAIYQTHADLPPQAMTLTEALAPVWPIARYALRDKAVVLVPQIDADLPPALYHPLHTTALIQHLVAMIGREWMAYGPLVIRSVAEPEAAALHFAAVGLRVSQEQWEGLFKAAGDEVYYKRLTAIGGSLNLLHSAQEGGVILRLPWATTNDDLNANNV